MDDELLKYSNELLKYSKAKIADAIRKQLRRMLDENSRLDFDKLTDLKYGDSIFSMDDVLPEFTDTTEPKVVKQTFLLKQVVLSSQQEELEKQLHECLLDNGGEDYCRGRGRCSPLLHRVLELEYQQRWMWFLTEYFFPGRKATERRGKRRGRPRKRS